VLTVPPPCSSSIISAATSSDDDTSSKTDLLTIEKINEIFKNQIKKLEESSNIEVNIFRKNISFKDFFFLEKNS